MIGYNVKEINDLMEALDKSYTDIKNAMENPWNTLTAAMRKEWVGPDEIANETNLANALNELYGICSDTITGVAGNVSAVGEAWKSFQGENVLENGAAADVSLIQQIKEVQVGKKELTLQVKNEAFAEDTVLGLVNGLQSAEAVTAAIDEYAKTVYSKVEGLYQELDAGKAFLGEDQAPKITAYLHEMGKMIGKLTTCIKNVKENIGKAAAAYQSQAASTSEQISQLHTDVDTEQALF